MDLRGYECNFKFLSWGDLSSRKVTGLHYMSLDLYTLDKRKWVITQLPNKWEICVWGWMVQGLSRWSKKASWWVKSELVGRAEAVFTFGRIYFKLFILNKYIIQKKAISEFFFSPRTARYSMYLEYKIHLGTMR